MWGASHYRGRDRSGEDSTGGNAVEAVEPVTAYPVEAEKRPDPGLHEAKAWQFR